jgi:hypothetical protein
VSVPSAVATSVESAAISSETRRASPMPGTPNGSFQASSENCCQMKLKRPCGLLNENSRMIPIGSSR